MKKICSLVALLLCLALLLPTHGIVASATEATEKSLLVLGDSIAAHFGVPDGAGYDTLLAKRLSENGEKWTSTNWGVSGYTSEDLVTQLSRKMQSPSERRVLENASLITVSIGGNNLLRLLREYGLEGISIKDSLSPAALIKLLTEGSEKMSKGLSEDLGATMRLIRKHNPNAIVLVQNIHNVARDFNGGISPLAKPITLVGLADRFFAQTLKVIEEGAEKYGYYVADTYGAFRDSSEKPLLRPELIHPNEQGHRLIAEVLYDTYGKVAQPLAHNSSSER